MKTPALDAPMTEAEEDKAWAAWATFRANVNARSPSTMLELLEVLSPIVGEVFELRKTLNEIWRGAEDRHYGRLDVVKPFRRGVAGAKKVAPTQAPRSYDTILSDLGMTEAELDAELIKAGLLQSPGESDT